MLVAVQFEISDLRSEAQDSSNFEIIIVMIRTTREDDNEN
jgi:hypothetical protein